MYIFGNWDEISLNQRDLWLQETVVYVPEKEVFNIFFSLLLAKQKVSQDQWA